MRSKFIPLNDVPNMELDDNQLPEYREPGTIEVMNNNIYFYSDIEREKMLLLTKTLKQREEEMLLKQQQWSLESPPPIHLHIQSYGGIAHSGLAGYDHLRNMKVPIYTYVDGVSASAATLLSIAGSKRFIYQNAFMLIHQARYNYWGIYTHEDIKDELENSENLMKVLKRIYLERTKIPEKKLDDLMKKDLYFDAEESLKYGLVDVII